MGSAFGSPPTGGGAIDSRAKALLVARAALEKHAEDVVVMDLRALSSVTDYFVVCTAGSSRQIMALKEHVEDTLHEQRCPVWHAEGTVAEAPRGVEIHQWVLVDCGDVVIHLFDQAARAFYGLERLWADAPRVVVHPFNALLPRIAA